MNRVIWANLEKFFLHNRSGSINRTFFTQAKYSMNTMDSEEKQGLTSQRDPIRKKNSNS